MHDLSGASSSGPRKKRASTRDSEQGGIEGVEDDETENTPTGTRKTITLQSGGQLSIALSVDLFELSKSDREFVFGLIDSLHNYEVNGSAKESTE